MGTFRIAVKRKSPALAKGSQVGGEGQRESFIPKRGEKAKGIVRLREMLREFSYKGEKNM